MNRVSFLVAVMKQNKECRLEKIFNLSSSWVNCGNALALLITSILLEVVGGEGKGREKYYFCNSML